MLSRATIDCLTQNDPIPALLGGEYDWVRTYGRTAGSGDATLLYESVGGIPALRAVRLGQGSQMVAGVGCIEIADWSQDKALPILDNIRLRHPHLQPVRYRPGKRCTFKSDGKHSYFAKVVADSRGAEIVQHGRMLWAASRAGRLGFGVARPAGWLPSLQMIVHHTLPGVSMIQELKGAGGPALARRMGTANASLANSGLTPAARYDYSWQVKRTAKYADRLRRMLETAGPLLDAILGQLLRIDPGAANRPIHGAPHAHQWLRAGEQLNLVDFDRFGLGDPELDVATFLTEWDFESGSMIPGVGEAYRGGYAQSVTINDQLVEAYRVHKYIAKAMRTMTAIRPNAADRALEILEDAAKRAGRLV
jgi:hypothetical protein